MRKALFVLLLLVSFMFMSCDYDPYVVGQVKTVSELVDAFKDESKGEIDIKAGTYSFDDDLKIGRDVKLFVDGGKAVLSFPEGKGVVATEKLGDGDLTISDIDIDGKLVINGGGSNSIHLENVKVDEVVLDKTITDSSKELPRLVIKGETEVAKLVVKQDGVLDITESKDVDKPLGTITVGEDIDEIIVIGDSSKIEESLDEGSKDKIKSGVARIGNEYYEDFHSAIKALKPNDTLDILIDIVFDVKSDISKENAPNITVPCTIEGNNHSILYKGEKPNDNSRMLSISQVENGLVSIKDLSIISETFSTWFRGLNIYDNNSTTIKLHNVNINIPHYYAINIATGNTSTSIEMNDCNIKGWATIYNHSSGIKLDATDCTFDSVNPVSSGGVDNSFTNVIVAEYYDLAQGVGDSKDNTFTFNNCSFYADKEHPESDVSQSVFDIRSPYNNKLYINDCKYIKTTSPQFIRVAVDTTYCDDLDKRSDMMFSSTVFENGIEMSIFNSDERFYWYIDTSINSEIDFGGYDYPYNPIPVIYELTEGESETSIERELDGERYRIDSSFDNTKWSITYTKIT